MASITRLGSAKLRRGLLLGTAKAVASGPSLPSLTFTRNGTAFTTATAAGTVLGSIGNVPTGVTPTVTPNDGRLAIGGSSGAWTLVVGLSASSAGTINGSANAVGANSVAFSLDVSTAGGGASIAPVVDWRLPILAAASSQSTWNTALVASSDANKTFPVTGTVTAGSTFVVPLKFPAITAPGGMIHFVYRSTSNGLFTLTAEESYDSTNGTDGTWATIPSSSYAATGLNSTGKGQIVRLATGAARWARLTFVTSGGSGTICLKAHQLPASGKPFIFGYSGASKESLGLGTNLVFDEIQKQFPNYDPIVFDYSNGGVGGGAIRLNLQKLLTEVPELQYGYAGQFAGNDVTSSRPYSTATQTTRDGLASDFQQMIDVINGATGKTIFLPDLDYRNYQAPNAVNGITNQENGSKPFNENIYAPLVASQLPSQYDTARGVPIIHPYSLQVQKVWYVGGDGIHERDVGFGVLRTELIRIMFGRVINGAYPTKPWETLAVEKAEASLLYPDKVAAQQAVDALPASSYRTTMLARIAAIAAPVDAIQIALRQANTGIITANWNVLVTPQTVGAALASPIKVDGTAATGWSAIVTTAGSAAYSTGGLDTGSDLGDMPDDILIGGMYTDTGAPTWTLEVTVPAGTYKVEAITTGATSSSTRSAVFTVNGVSKAARNPFMNTIADVWTGVAPVSGKITFSTTAASGSTRSYVSGIRVTKTA